MKRISAIDFTRGLVMVIMALDHTRDLIHIHSLTQDPTDLSTTSPILFFTRWITHLCAPIFVFLTGTSAFLSFQRENNFSKSRNFLLSRGIWLLVLEFTLVNFGIWFDIKFHNVLFQVIGTIGFGLILLSLVLKIPSKTLGIIGLIIIFIHDLLILIPANESSLLKALSLLFNRQFIPFLDNHLFIMAYPPIPWFGIMLIGFASGQLFLRTDISRRNLFLKAGIISLSLFILLRFLNIYGDPVKWMTQKDIVYTFLSFMNVSKYPPSLLYTLATLGIMFLILSFAEGIKNKFTEIITVYGKVPLFYYLIHWYLLHCIMIFVLLIQGFKWQDLNFETLSFGRPATENGLPLWAVYLVWLSVVIILYPACKWYSNYKETHRQNKLLRYL